jgi:hypothetical protein
MFIQQLVEVLFEELGERDGPEDKDKKNNNKI